jgi:hypothetical protein
MHEKRIWGGILLTAIVLGFMLLFLRGGFAHDLPGIPKENQSWYQNAETNPEARATFPSPWQKCCNHAEVIPVKDIIFPTQDHGWRWNDKGEIKNIPNVIIHWNEAAPDNRPTLFVYNGTMTCFYPPQGGV